MKRIAIMLVFLLLGSMAIAVEEEEPEAALAPDIAAAAFGARPLGMGGAFVALADDTNAIFTNPAGLSQINDWSITSMSTQLLGKVDYRLVGAAYSWGIGTLGVGYIGTTAPCGYRYDDFGALLSDEPITYSSNMILLSYGLEMTKAMKTSKSMGKISVGATIKAVSMGFTGIDDASASGSALDLGLKITPRDFPVTYGLMLKNLGGSIKWSSETKETLEGGTRLGACAKIIGKDGFYKDLFGQLLGGIEMEMPAGDKPTLIHAGLEYRMFDMLSLRAGLDQGQISKTEASNDLTAGIGVEYSGFRFDYAYRMDSLVNELSSNYFSLSYAPEITEKERGKEEGKEKAGDIYELPKEYMNIYVY